MMKHLFGGFFRTLFCCYYGHKHQHRQKKNRQVYMKILLRSHSLDEKKTKKKEEENIKSRINLLSIRYAFYVLLKKRKIEKHFILNFNT